jgi:hypothetical protein
MKPVLIALVLILGFSSARAEGFYAGVHLGFPALVGAQFGYEVSNFGVRAALSPAFAGVDVYGQLAVSESFSVYGGVGLGVALVDQYLQNRFSPLAWRGVIGANLAFTPGLSAFLEFTPTFLSDLQPSPPGGVPNKIADAFRAFLGFSVNLGLRFWL